MAQSSPIKMQGYISFPRQKISDSKKDDAWFKKNVDFAEHLLTSDVNLRSNFKNKKTNYNLRANIINVKDFEKYINPDNLDLESLPASFQHIGIENSKINLLLGEYSKRKKEFKAYISANDSDGIGRKESQLMEQIKAELTDVIKSTSISPEEIQKRLQQLEQEQRQFQDVAEITANKILKKEYKEGDFDFIFLKTFEDLLTGGEEIMYCGVLGGNPVMRRVNPMNLYTMGGNSMYIEDADIIVEYGYKSIGQVIDDYWDKLSEDDIEFLESGKSDASAGGGGIGLNRDISVYDYYGEQGALSIFHPNEMGTRTFAGAFDTYGNVRVLKVCWRSRRKIGERTYFDPYDGSQQKDYVPEDYKPNKELGESVKWIWVNEWMEADKIADHIYTNMRPVPYASKSIVNKSKGTPPYVGSVNSTNDYKVQSLMDIMKPLAFSYDIAYYKRELAIATYKGSFTALNSSLVPSGWDPKEWMRYVTINKFAWLDPTNEILKGPSQGKSAGAFNTLTATNVQVGDPNEIAMYTNLMLDIEDKLGKIAGVTGAREGQIQNREAVGNVEREVAQTSHITEKWFAIDNNFRKRVLTKFLECCKYAYKANPKKGQFLLDDMEQELVSNFDEFCNTDFDLHVSNSSNDQELYRNLQALIQPAIQNGQATFADVIALSNSESTQELAKRLENSAKRIKEEQEKMQQQKMQQDQQMAQEANAVKQQELEFKVKEHDDKIAVQREKIQADLTIAGMKEMNTNVRHAIDGERVDTDKNGIDDTLDLRRVDVDENYKNEQIRLAEEKLRETQRANKANEEIKKKAANKPTGTK